MKNQQISIRLFRDSRPASAAFPSSAKSPQQAAHFAGLAGDDAAKLCPAHAEGTAVVITARPFPYGLPTNRIVVC